MNDEIKEVVSTCIYCGCGCKIIYKIKNNEIVGISGWKEDYMSEGIPCIKGLTIHEVWNKNRIKKPLIKEKEKFKEISWSEAIQKFYEMVKDAKEDEIFINGSGKITNEANFILYKLGVCLLNTKNIDSCCGRLCHISTVKGLTDCYGHPNLTLIDNLNEIDCLIIIGSNPAVNYPVFWNKVLKRKKEGLKIISIQSLLNLTSKFGDVFIEIEPGTEIALINGIIHWLLKNDKNIKKGEIKKIENFDKLVNTVKKYTLSYVKKICKINEKDFIEACKIIANSKKVGIFHGMGFTQHKNSLENIYSLINLALVKDAYIINLRGEINVQGVGDVFSADVEKLKKIWNFDFEKPHGNLIQSLIYDPVNLAIITEFNPAQSLPYLEKVHQIFEEIDLIYIGSYFNLTSEFAKLILPIPALFESYGTITNGEQRIRLVRPVIKTDALEILDIAKLLSRKFGKSYFFNYKDSKEIFKEIVEVVPYYNGINPDDVYNGKDALAKKWIKHKIFMPADYIEKEEKRTKKYPFLLTTFREQHHFLTSEITDTSETLKKLDKDRLHVFINQEDAKKFNIKDEDKIKIESKVGSIIGFARISNIVPKGLLATRFHYKEMLVNKLFPLEHDPITYIPNYKSCAVRIKKINEKEKQKNQNQNSKNKQKIKNQSEN